MRPDGGLCGEWLLLSGVAALKLSCQPHTASQTTIFTFPCREKKQLYNALFRSRNGAVGAEIC
eukprot:280277-Pelagomonas_calceolata.AAC.3